MPKQRRMNKQARHDLVVSYQDEYRAAGRGKRGEILTVLAESTGYDRKYLSRLLRGKYQPHARRKQRGRHYGAALDDVLRVIFEAHDGICPERIHPNLLCMAEHLAAHGELRLTEDVREQHSGSASRLCGVSGADCARMSRGSCGAGRAPVTTCAAKFP